MVKKGPKIRIVTSPNSFTSEIDLSSLVSGDVRPMASVTSPGRGRDKQLRAQSGSEP